MRIALASLLVTCTPMLFGSVSLAAQIAPAYTFGE
jgi:hypothetical protein